MPRPASRRADPFWDLVATARRLHAPGGCPWDRTQTVRSLVPYLVEETWEVFCAHRRRREDELEEELGDVLYTVLFLALLAERDGRWTLNGLLNKTRRKMQRRHPHVFGAAHAASAKEAYGHWQAAKQRERKRKPAAPLPKLRPKLVRDWEALYRSAVSK